MSNALGRLAAAIVLDTTDWAVGTKEAQRLAGETATAVTNTFGAMEKAVKSSIGSMATSLTANLGVSLTIGGFAAFAKGALDAADSIGLAAQKAPGDLQAGAGVGRCSSPGPPLCFCFAHRAKALATVRFLRSVRSA